ncbi:MAG: indole-3-glycerol phosphate synthase TrpC [Myxococcota bacterium]
MSILDEIVEVKRVEVAAAKERSAPAELAARADSIDEPTRGFRSALLRHEPPSVIAELKRRSPSKGEIRPDFDPVACAREYAAGGAAAVSILTDETYFGGHLDYLRQVREAVPLPLLRKDFTVDVYQIDEARVAGADAILLIVSALSAEQLAEFSGRARDLDLDVLVEVHDEAELQAALAVGADLVGVNNRDLRTFEVDLETTARLAGQVPSNAGVLLVAESGIEGPADLQYLAEAGAGAFLVGESLMREPDIAHALAVLLSEPTSRQEGRIS